MQPCSPSRRVTKWRKWKTPRFHPPSGGVTLGSDDALLQVRRPEPERDQLADRVSLGRRAIAPSAEDFDVPAAERGGFENALGAPAARRAHRRVSPTGNGDPRH